VKRFYLTTPLTPDEIINVPIEIVRHMHVLRVRVGELVELFDGKNGSCQSEVLNLDKRAATLKIIKINPLSPMPIIVTSLAIALIANDRMDLIIQKAVELGINHIIPVDTERSARIVNERSANKLSHWQNIIISSCSQCGQNLLPTITLPIPINSLYENSKYDVKVIMNIPDVDCHARQSLARNDSNIRQSLARNDDNTRQSLDCNDSTLQGLGCDDDNTRQNLNCNDDLRGDDNRSIKSAILLVGPEGGFTDTEAKLAASHGYQSLQLGNLIMRAETAAIAGISILNLNLKQWDITI
jgi:16S rRNA (uracil1498-N3)-methyltransferase